MREREREVWGLACKVLGGALGAAVWGSFLFLHDEFLLEDESLPCRGIMNPRGPLYECLLEILTVGEEGVVSGRSAREERASAHRDVCWRRRIRTYEEER